MEQFAVFGHEEEQEPIDRSEQLAIELVFGQRPRMELLAETVVAGMADEATAKSFNGFGDTNPQVVQHPGALLAGKVAPLFQPTIDGLVRFDTRLMTEQP